MIAIMSAELIDYFSRLPSRRRTLEPGQYLFHRGDPILRLHWLEVGTVHLQRFTADGGAVVMQRATSGAVIAEASIFAKHYHCDAISVGPAIVRHFDVREVRALVEREPAFTASLARYLAEEVMRMRSRSEIVSLRTVGARLDAWLALHDDRLPPSGKRVDLARELSVSPEALYRELARRRDANVA
jgi:CRP-like cAMP-binding protein